MDSYLNPFDEDHVIEEMSLSRLVLSITDTNDCEEEEELYEEAESHVGLYSVKEQLHSLAVTKAIFAREGTVSKEAQNIILERQRVLSLEKQATLRQTSIWYHFGKVTTWAYNPDKSIQFLSTAEYAHNEGSLQHVPIPSFKDVLSDSCQSVKCYFKISFYNTFKTLYFVSWIYYTIW